MKRIKWILPIIVAMLTMGVLATGFAMPPKEGSLHGFVGKVVESFGEDTTAVSSEDGTGTLIVETANGETVVIALPAEYVLKAPGRAEEDVVAATLLQPGAVVAVLTQWTGEGFEALQVLVKPETPATPITGAVTEVDETTRTITVTTPSGEQYTFTLPEDVELPAVGEVITVFRGPGEGDVNRVKVRNLALGLVKASQIRERLENCLAEVTDEDASDEGAGLKAQLADRLRTMVQQHTDRQLQVLERVQERASEKAQAAIEKAKQDVMQNRDRLQQVIDKVQDRIDALQERWQQWKANNASGSQSGGGSNR